ncbi:hypothetical protein D5S17_34720 [Pseudonocardiaceae bacterium YIM PH 21723]|nr:hypothetical protein D5S17_34720 [Pseudonocardiaceae bacterium YIM PH 21723]
MLCVTNRQIPVLCWLSLPVLFLSAVVGVAGLILSGWNGDIAVPSTLFGVTAAITLIVGGGVVWRSELQRHLLRWPYGLIFLIAGVTLDGVRIPVSLAVSLGLPAALMLTLAVTWLAREDVDCRTSAGVDAAAPVQEKAAVPSAS